MQLSVSVTVDNLPQTIVNSAVPQAENINESSDNTLMECEVEDGTIQCCRTCQTIVKVMLRESSENFANEQRTIRNVLFEVPKINCTSFIVDRNDKYMACFLWSSEEVSVLASYDFKEMNPYCIVKLLTNNTELHSRKIKQLLQIEDHYIGPRTSPQQVHQPLSFRISNISNNTTERSSNEL